MNGPKINAKTILLPKNAIYGMKKGISLCNLKIGQSSLIFLQINSQLVDLQVGFSVVLFYRHFFLKRGTPATFIIDTCIQNKTIEMSTSKLTS